MKTQTHILDNRLYYTRKIELHRKGKKSRTVRVTPILISGIWCTPHLTGMCGTRPFYGGSERRAVTHTRPAFPKMPTAMSGDDPPKGVKTWGEGPLRPKEISRYRDTLGQIRAADNTVGRSATRHMERYRPRLIYPLAAKSLVLITVRRAHYGKMGKAPTTMIWAVTFFFSQGFTVQYYYHHNLHVIAFQNTPRFPCISLVILLRFV